MKLIRNILLSVVLLYSPLLVVCVAKAEQSGDFSADMEKRVDYHIVHAGKISDSYISLINRALDEFGKHGKVLEYEVEYGYDNSHYYITIIYPMPKTDDLPEVVKREFVVEFDRKTRALITGYFLSTGW